MDRWALDHDLLNKSTSLEYTMKPSNVQREIIRDAPTIIDVECGKKPGKFSLSEIKPTCSHSWRSLCFNWCVCCWVGLAACKEAVRPVTQGTDSSGQTCAQKAKAKECDAKSQAQPKQVPVVPQEKSQPVYTVAHSSDNSFYTLCIFVLLVVWFIIWLHKW